MNEREQLAKDNWMTIEFVNWFFDNKKDGCGNVWFMMMAAMWEGWCGRESKCSALAAENAELKAVESNLVRNIINDLGDTEFQYEKVQTQATDAFLAEVRAHDLNAFIRHHSAELDAHIKNGGEQFDEKSVRIRDIIVSARLFREQIRKEADQ